MSLFNFGFSQENSKSKNEDEKKENRNKSKQKYEKEKRKRSFCEKWTKDFDWLEYEKEKNVMFCVPCKKYESDRSKPFVSGSDNFRIDALKTHENSTAHQTFAKKNEIEMCQTKSSTVYTSHTGEITATSSNLGQGACAQAVIGPMDIAVRRLNEEQNEQLTACFNTAYFIAKEELPFSLYPSLLDLQEKNGVTLPLSYRTDQACRRFMTFIYNEMIQQAHTALKESRVLSIMFDGATDVSVSENEIVYARVVEKGVPRNIFVKINSVEHAHAEGVLGAINEAMDSVDPEWNWRDKLVATGSDGASVNLGRRHSVAKLLKDQVPHMIAIHCVCHRLELGAIDAMKERSGKLFADLKSVLLSLHKHYRYSAKALRELEMLAEALDEKMLKPVNLSGTRWMPHLNRCLDVLLGKYNVFVTHFENTLEGRTGTAEVQGRARLILNHLKDYSLLLYMHYLKDVLKILSDLSLQFQNDSCGLPDATSALETACLRLVALQQRPGEHLQSFLDEVQDFTFKNVQLRRPTLTQEQLNAKLSTLTDLVIQHITHRVGDIESDALLKAMQIFYPVNLPEAEAERAVYGEEGLAMLCEHYAVLLQRLGCDINQLREAEWPALKVQMNRLGRNATISQFYNQMFSNPNLQETLKNILMLVEIMLCVPVSSAICERGFSVMSRVKTDWRSKLEVSMLNILMAISIEGPESREYNAQRALEMWWHGGQRARRPEFGEIV